MKKLAYILCLIELALLLLVPLCAWLCSVLGYDVVNLVSEEGLRWLFSHAGRALVSYQLAVIILLLSAIGAVQECHIVQQLLQRKGQGRALWVALTFFGVALLLLLSPTVWPHNALLGITGSLVPSPWLVGFPLALCVICIVTSILYGAMTHTLDGFLGIPRLMCVGISRYSIWIVNAMLLTILVRIIKFSFL